MKKTIYYLAIFALLSACTGGKQKNGNNESHMADTTAIEAIMEKPVDIAYTQCLLAYLIEVQLYFYSLNENRKVKFVEEPTAIYNFVFNDKGEKLYYSVERDNSLWLKEAVISDSIVSPQLLHAWTLKRDDELPNGYPSQLLFREVEELYHDGELLLEYDFDIGSYNFRKFDIYNLAYESTFHGDKESDWGLIGKFNKGVSSDKRAGYFETTREQLYYMHNNVKICLTDKLDINSLKTKEDIDDEIKTEFHNYTFSLDGTKVLFKILLGYNEETFRGPYCIANADGSKQIILEQAGESWNKHPLWLKNNSLVFIDNEKNLFITSNDDNSVQKIAKNVLSYLGR